MISQAEFQAFTHEQQIAALQNLGLAALKEFGVEPTLIEPLVHFENTTFHVTSPQGEFNLRISRPGQQSSETLQSEIDLLTALATEGFRVPKPYQDRIVQASVPQVPEARNVVLFHWLNGEFLRNRLTPAEAPLIGKAMAELHEFTANWTPPENFNRLTLHKWAWGNPQDNTIKDPIPGLPEEDRELINRLIHQTCQLIPALPQTPETYGLIHADLHVGNLMIEDGHLNIIDFDDTGYAWLYYDFAAALAFHLNHPQFEAIRDGMLAGYETVRPLPPNTRELLNAFIGMRLSGVSEWILGRTDNPQLREIGPVWVHDFCEGLRRLLTLAPDLPYNQPIP